ncbi:hypothetical protein B2G71_04825 [Novosphingobium sp. PC22D]|uniref:TAT-variant-translocated molybdopterin oxidoreductase n=1 Tax=Novosphingobium sp. PC22D TaxID=1962403 RepID=UPI000BF11155|nr:TAT-variant-translocated molybdopterin oxidoreductase [Novosphingobium sp. PC22D]PEQ13654.1 hypothetical protein B2G71_04825 [Novosphingobium sp. PC22D]
MSGDRPVDGLEGLRASSGRHYWRSLEELWDKPGFRARVAREFPALARIAPDVDRRGFFKCLAATVALAGLDGCERQAAEDAYPLVRDPDGSAPGSQRAYATAWELDGIGQPVIGQCRDGRPIKLEGNPGHPASRGATDAFTQAALLGLYDPSRSPAPRHDDGPATWDDFDAFALGERQRLDAARGRGFRLLTGPVGSPTLLRQIAELQERWPGMRWHVHAPLGRRDASRDLSFADAEAIVCFDDDPLGNGPFQTWHAGNWARRRRAFQQGQGDALLMVAEPSPTLTGVAAQHRLASAQGRIGVLLAALAAALRGTSGPGGIGPVERRWIEQAARTLRAHRGKSLVRVGAHHPEALQRLARAVNDELGNTAPARPQAGDSPPDLADLCRDMAAGAVATLLILDANPASSASPDLGFERALRRVPRRIHAGLHNDETALVCNWHLPLAHLLESWSDVRCAEGSAALVQPLVRPFLDVRSRHEVLAAFTGGERGGRAIVRATWPGDEAAWRARLVAGVVDAEPVGASPRAPSRSPGRQPPATPWGELELIFRPDPTIHDGAFAANPWLQEMPKPLTKLTWDNAFHIAPRQAERLGIANGDMVEVSVGGRGFIGPAWIVPGQAEDTILVHLGYGRRAGGKVADGCGFDAYAMRSAESPWVRRDVSLRKAGGRADLACTQTHWAMDGHDWIRSVNEPDEALPDKPEGANFYPPRKAEAGGPAWGMAIDLDLCIGCNACAVACVAENNVPMVGKEQVAKGREMHWLRIDRYYEGSAEDPDHAFQPVPCMHCEDAPCEMGCPVNATVHSPDGLNLQVYNRCIGTRTCSAYCPYKVRRFNWLDYTRDAEPARVAQRNPEVTVRDRGVMEKCTYCIQRIQTARIEADKDGRPLAEGEVVTACQQACPTQAIVFGDLSRPESAVSRRKADGRDYALLEEANTRPRTTYGAKISGGAKKA